MIIYAIVSDEETSMFIGLRDHTRGLERQCQSSSEHVVSETDLFLSSSNDLGRLYTFCSDAD